MTDPHPYLATYGLRLKRLFYPRVFYPNMLWRRSSSSDAPRRVAYLTFDDGPTPGVTHRLLDLLARHDAQATCFLIGENAERNPGLVRAIRDAGHTIGNHTYTHLDASRAAAETVTAELDRTTRLLEDLTGRSVRHMRPPYGRFTRPMRTWCRRREQQLTMWDVNPREFRDAATPRSVARHTLRPLRDGSLVLLHDTPDTERVTLTGLETILQRLTDRGWRFAAL